MEHKIEDPEVEEDLKICNKKAESETHWVKKRDSFRRKWGEEPMRIKKSNNTV